MDILKNRHGTLQPGRNKSEIINMRGIKKMKKFNYDNNEFLEVELLHRIYSNINEYFTCGLYGNNGYNLEVVNRYGQIEEKEFCVKNADILNFIRLNCYLEKYTYLIKIRYDVESEEYYISLNEILLED